MRVYEAHLRIFSKRGLRVQMDAKSGQLKNESKSELFRTPGDAKESANGATINEIKGTPDNTPGIAPKGAFQDIYKDVQKGAPDNTLKDALEIAIELHVFMPLSMHKSVHNDSIKDETEEATYVALESTSKISF